MRNGDLISDRSDVHDSTGVPPLHSRQNGETGVNGGPEIRLHGALEILKSVVLHRSDENRPGIVDQHIDWTEIVFDLRDHSFGLSPVRQIAFHCCQSLAAVAEIALHVRKFFAIPRAYSNVRAASGEFARHY